MIFSIDPIGKDGTKLFKNSSIDLQPGITILVGCNGSGKTTAMEQIDSYINRLETNDISSHYFLCCATGREIDRLIGFIGTSQTVEQGATMLSSSEGERISQFLISMFNWIWSECKKDEVHTVFAFLDSLDSGLDIPSIRMVLDTFEDAIEITKNRFNTDLRLVLSANDYAIVENRTCLDIHTGRTINFNSWSDYVDFCIRSNSIKQNRYSKQKKVKS